MKRIAMVKDGIVENIATWDGVTPWIPEGYELFDVTDITCDIGWIWDGQSFSPPPTE